MPEDTIKKKQTVVCMLAKINFRRINVQNLSLNTPHVVPVVVGQYGGADLECERERRGGVRLLDEPLLQRRQPHVLGDVGHDVGVEERLPTVD